MGEYRLAAVTRNVVVPGQAPDGTRIDLEDVESGSGRLRAVPPVRGGGGLLIETGDVLFAKLRPYLRKALRVETPGACSPEFLVLRPGPDLESRYLGYVVQGDAFVDAAVSTTDGAKMPRTSFEKLRATRIVVPRRDVQTTIADFLDMETERIDALVAAREWQRRLVVERERAWSDALVSAAGARVRVAKAVASIGQGESPQCENRPAGAGEVGVLKLSAVGTHGFLAGENKRLAGGSADDRLVVRTGDLLVTRANTPTLVGLAAVARVEPDAPRLLLPDLIYRLTLRSGYDPDYIQIALSTSDARGQISAAARGSSQTMVKVRGDDLRELRVPLPPYSQQQKIAHKVRSRRAVSDLAIAAIDRQIALLRERRQALITSAVTRGLQVQDKLIANAAA